MAATVRGRLAEDLRRLSADAGLSTHGLAVASGVSRSHLERILAGRAKPSVEIYARLTATLGADLSARLYPNTGPAVRDRHQARTLEWLLGTLHPRWRPFTEVGVRHPVRGAIDAVLHETRERVVVAIEIESELRRLEQQVRWAQEKAAALPSWPGWGGLTAAGDPPSISRLLIVRRTRATRRVATEFARQLAVAYPAHPDDAVAALAGTAPWPGPALVWVDVDTGGARAVRGR